MERTITIRELIVLASDLKSVHGENREYDRALVELVTNAAKDTMGNQDIYAKAIGVIR